MTGERTLVIVNGPSHLAVNLGFGREHLRCCPSSHTLDPFLNSWKFCQILLFIVCLVRSWVVRTSFCMVRREFKWSWTAGIEISEMIVERAQGSYPIIRKNGDWLVIE